MPRGSYEKSPEHREKIRQRVLAQYADPEWRAKWLEAMRRPERLAKIAKALTGLKRTAQHREKTRQANLGAKRSPAARAAMRRGSAHMSPENRAKVVAAAHSPEANARRFKDRTSFRTKIERLLTVEFKKRRLSFETHKTMFGHFLPDFVFEDARLIVQADGDYWHSLEKGRRRDQRFDALALADGWAVWRFGEKQIEMHAASIGKAVARFVRSH